MGKLIVLTGGTCGGKTYALKKLKTFFGEKIIVIPEVATALFEGEFPRPKVWTPEWHDSLQKKIIKKQVEFEDLAVEMAIKTEVDVIVCDRGLLDPAAYIEDGIHGLERRYFVDLNAAIKRYYAVIHLESLATIDPKMYNKMVASNPCRVESVEDSIRQEMALRHIWSTHPRRIHLNGDIEESVSIICEIIQGILNQNYH